MPDKNMETRKLEEHLKYENNGLSPGYSKRLKFCNYHCQKRKAMLLRDYERVNKGTKLLAKIKRIKVQKKNFIYTFYLNKIDQIQRSHKNNQVIDKLIDKFDRYSNLIKYQVFHYNSVIYEV